MLQLPKKSCSIKEVLQQHDFPAGDFFLSDSFKSSSLDRSARTSSKKTVKLPAWLSRNCLAAWGILIAPGGMRFSAAADAGNKIAKAITKQNNMFFITLVNYRNRVTA